MLAPSPYLMLQASPLHPVAPSIQRKASPASPPSQLGAPSSSLAFASAACWTLNHPAQWLMKRFQRKCTGWKGTCCSWSRNHPRCTSRAGKILELSVSTVDLGYNSCPSARPVRPHQIKSLSFAINLCHWLSVKLALSYHFNSYIFWYYR